MRDVAITRNGKTHRRPAIIFSAMIVGLKVGLTLAFFYVFQASDYFDTARTWAPS